MILDKQLIIVAGVSGSGKSTFIDKVLFPKILSSARNNITASEVNLVFASSLRNKFDLGDKPTTVIHYNSLIAYDVEPNLKNLNLNEEPIFKQLLNHARNCSVYLCYTVDDVLMRRIGQRKQVEPLFSKSRKIYPAKKIRSQLVKINQRQLLLEMAGILSKFTSDINIVVSSAGSVSLVSLQQFQQEILCQGTNYSIDNLNVGCSGLCSNRIKAPWKWITFYK